MTKQAYDEVNNLSIEKNDALIRDALIQIRQDKKLKPSISQLVKLTGIHRNTISNRGWPKHELDSIKQERDRDSKKSETNTREEVSALKSEMERAQQEAIYWFNEANKFKESLEHYQALNEELKGSRDFYLQNFELKEKEYEQLEKKYLLIAETKGV